MLLSALLWVLQLSEEEAQVLLSHNSPVSTSPFGRRQIPVLFSCALAHHQGKSNQNTPKMVKQRTEMQQMGGFLS